MRWTGRRQSHNVEDRRGSSRSGFPNFPRINMGGGMPRSGAPGRPVKLTGGSLVTLIIIIGLVWLFNGNPLSLLSGSSGSSPATFPTTTSGGQPTDTQGQFVATVLADTEQVWTDLFAQRGLTYRLPTLVLFRDHTQSGCGSASAATGPFYCPLDQKIYIDLSFFDQLSSQLGAPGDFAQAYVIAHEVAHHVQHLLGTTDRVHAARARLSETEYNDLSVRLELQADFLAGVWAHHADKRWRILEPGDIEEAIRAAGAVGDDHLQRQSQGYVVPDSFTHGTSEQRIRWFRRGLESGDINQGDTFAVDQP